MTAYNIVNPNAMLPGQPEDISVVVSNLQAIAAVLNGGIDDGNLNAAAAIAAAKLAGYPADITRVLRGDGSWGAPTTVAGDEMAYAQWTAPVTVTVAAEATPTDIVTLPAVTFDGATTVAIELWVPYVQVPANAAMQLIFVLTDGATPAGRFSLMGYGVAVAGYSGYLGRIRLTPAAGTKTYKISAWINGGNGVVNAVVGAGPGATSGQYSPGHAIIRRINPVPPTVTSGTVTPLTYGTTLPPAPADGQLAVLVDSITNPTYQWMFRYNAGSISAYKWELVGGGDAIVSNLVSEAFSGANNIWTDTTTVGPTFVVPRTGIYRLIAECLFINGAATAHNYLQMGIGIGAGWTSPLIQALNNLPAVSGTYVSVNSSTRQTLTATQTLLGRYMRSAAGAVNVQARIIRVLPVQVQ